MSALSAKPEDAAPAALGACGVGVGGDGDGDGGGAPEASFPSPAVALASGSWHPSSTRAAAQPAFYETVEKFHRDLITFLPRYIGVLNVTFKKQPRRRSTAKRDEGSRNSWGATMVNKKLRNEVFNDAFLKQPEVGMTDPAKKQDGTGNGSRPRETWNDTVKLQRPQSYSNKTYLSGITGTSVPEPNVSAGTLVAQERQRRYSGTALQRDAMDGRQSWGELQCYEEPDQAGFQGDCEEPMAPALETASANLASEEVGAIGVGQHHRDCLQDSDAPSATPLMVPNTTVELERLPRPSNPKEAQTQRDSRVEYFLLMEDLTAGMKRPCIMDLKMGTRQYGVDANSKKQRSQQGKCAKTTSRALGVRVCGLQVWDVESQSYVFKDKYYGRSIKAGQEFQEALTRFLYDGVDKGSILRHVPTVLQKLSELEVIIKRLRGYRFYASSLLMFYDGDTSEVEYDTALDDSTTDVGTDIEEGTRRSRKNKRDIDFKIADFANSVTAGDLAKDRPCPPAHPTEPDRGFLRGLRSLRRYFLRIQQDTRAELGVATYHRRDAQIENVGKDMDMDMDEDDDDDEDAEYVSE
ncbi:hypothetical protein P8C59_006293 [Phyllachora maydis]|uniref:Kinase n=1 Tax=Phyllachora maydis TaxID=1825666 RepID=A0AAD9I6K8_9PEZI|nr:hypothetical protein P8C59_006293 [Phyllachora maydis]